MVSLTRFWKEHTTKGLKGYAGLIGYAIILLTHVQILNAGLPVDFQQTHAAIILIALGLIFVEHY